MQQAVVVVLIIVIDLWCHCCFCRCCCFDENRLCCVESYGLTLWNILSIVFGSLAFLVVCTIIYGTLRPFRTWSATSHADITESRDRQSTLIMPEDRHHFGSSRLGPLRWTPEYPGVSGGLRERFSARMFKDVPHFWQERPPTRTPRNKPLIPDWIP